MEIIDNMPVELELPPIKPGADWEWTFYIEDDNGNPVNTTGYMFSMVGKARVNGAQVFVISTANGKCVMSASVGKFACKLPASETALLNERSIVWDCLLRDGAGGVTPLFQGVNIPIEVLNAVTPPF